MIANYSPAAMGYFADHAISSALAGRLGVAERDGGLVFTVRRPDGGSFQRVRPLGGRTRVLQPKGEPLRIWWPARPPEYVPVVLLAEGEGDALAALTALEQEPIAALPEFAVASLPGASMPVERIVAELQRIECKFAYLAFDGDEPGRKLARRLSAALDLCRIRSISLPIRAHRDLADELAAVPESLRGRRLGSLLLNAESPAIAARVAA